MKCYNCKKKIGIIKHTCECNKFFCVKCRLPEYHRCTFNFKNKDKLITKLVKVEFEKISKI